MLCLSLSWEVLQYAIGCISAIKLHKTMNHLLISTLFSKNLGIPKHLLGMTKL